MPVPSLSSKQTFITGLKDGLPIGLGYISVSFTFGMMAVTRGLPAWSAILISFTNLTSAGQFAGLDTIAADGSFVEIALVQLVINLRYALMSLSWSQKLPSDFKFWQRFVIAFGDTDEILARSAAFREGPPASGPAGYPGIHRRTALLPGASARAGGLNPQI